MRVRFRTALCLFALALLPHPARAAEPVPGNSCTGTPGIIANSFQWAGAPENGGAVNGMFCNGTTWSGVINFQSAGRVGIGNTTPGATLDVTGNMKATYATSGGIAITGTANTGAAIGVEGTTASTTTNAAGVYGSATGGSGVTIGVAGSNNSTGTNAAALYGTETAASGQTAGVYGLDSSSTGYGGFFINNGGGYAAAFTGGNVGVKTTTPVTALDVNGTIRFAYGGESCSASTLGGLYYSSSTHLMYGCLTAGSWTQIGSFAVPWTPTVTNTTLSGQTTSVLYGTTHVNPPSSSSAIYGGAVQEMDYDSTAAALTGSAHIVPVVGWVKNNNASQTLPWVIANEAKFGNYVSGAHTSSVFEHFSQIDQNVAGATIDNAYGTITDVGSNDGTIGVLAASALQVDANTGTINALAGMYIPALTANSGTISGLYGLYFAQQTVSGIGQRYAVYNADPGATIVSLGNVGIGTTSPAAPLHVNGEAIVGMKALACGGTTAGAIRYNSSTGTLQFCDGSNWNGIVAVAGMTLISTQTASASASLQFTNLPTGYNTLFLNCAGLLVSTSSSYLQLLVGEGAGPTWQTGAHYTIDGYYGGVGNGNINNNTYASLLTQGVTGTTMPQSLKLYIDNVGSSSAYKIATYHLVSASASNIYSEALAGYWNNDTNPVTGLKLTVTTGNIASGTCSLYGMN